MDMRKLNIQCMIIIIVLKKMKFQINFIMIKIVIYISHAIENAKNVIRKEMIL